MHNNTPTTTQAKNALLNCEEMFQAHCQHTEMLEQQYMKGVITLVEYKEKEHESLQQLKTKCGSVIVNLLFDPSLFDQQ